VSVLLYGVLPEPCDAEPPAGVRALHTPAGVAWVRTLAPGESPAPAEQRATLRVALDAGRTPAPARAGSRFDDDDALVTALARSADAWRAALARVHDRVEMMVFVVPVAGDAFDGDPSTGDPAGATLRTAADRRAQGRLARGRSTTASPVSGSPAEGTGRAYLERVRAGLAQAEAAERWRVELRAALGDLAAADAVVAHPSGHGVLVSHLVPRAREGAYRARVAAWRATAGVPRAVVLGPWPPFSFVAHESR